MNIRGVKIDEVGLAQGLFNMIPEADKACMKYGMLPARYMEMFEKQLRDKLVRVEFKSEDLTEDDAKACGLGLVPEVVAEIMRAVCANLLRIATEKGICIV